MSRKKEEAVEFGSEFGERRVIEVLPEELVDVNPQVEIFTRSAYESMAGAFSWNRYEPPQIARMQVIEKGETREQWAVVDGHTRLKFFADWKSGGLVVRMAEQGSKIVGAPTTMKAVDITDDLLEDPTMVDPAERDGRTAINVVEYLRSIVEWTKQHAEIAPRRTAAHFVNGWGGMVGMETAEKFPATAALNLLATPEVPKATRKLLEEGLLPQVEQLPELTNEEKGAVVGALADMNDVLRQLDILPRVVYQEAFAMVASRDQVIGGEEQAVTELFGLLQVPSVSEKIEGMFPGNIMAQQQAREDLSRAALGGLARLIEVSPKGDLSVVMDVVNDEDLDFGQTVAVLGSEDIYTGYRTLKVDLRRQRMLDLSEELLGGEGELGDVGEEYVGRFAELRMSMDELPGVVGAIHSAVTEIDLTRDYVAWLDREKGALNEQGVKEETMSEVVEVLEERIEDLAEAQNSFQISKRLSALRVNVEEAEGRIKHEQVVYRATSLVSEVLTPWFNEKHGKELARVLLINAASFLIDEGEAVFDEEMISVVLDGVRQLDSDLLVQVFEKKMSLGRAVDLQGKREVEEVVAPADDVAEISVEEVAEVLDPEVVVNQNRLLEEWRSQAVDFLAMIELTREEVTGENRDGLVVLANEMLKLVVDHPDPRRMWEEHQNLLDEIGTLQQKIVFLQGRESTEERY